MGKLTAGVVYFHAYAPAVAGQTDGDWYAAMTHGVGDQFGDGQRGGVTTMRGVPLGQMAHDELASDAGRARVSSHAGLSCPHRAGSGDGVRRLFNRVDVLDGVVEHKRCPSDRAEDLRRSGLEVCRSCLTSADDDQW